MAEIGEQGESFNFSSAGRAANFRPDIDRVKQYDPYQQKYVRLTRTVLAVGLLTVAGAIRLWTANHGIWAGVSGVLAVLLLLGAYLLGRGAGATVYSSGLLIPAYITALEPLQLVVLATMNNGEDDEGTDIADEIFGIRRVTLKELPIHSLRIGERVPCAAAFGGDNEGAWGHFEPRPLVWATDNLTIIKVATETIPEKEWARLSELSTQLPEITEDQVAFFNADLAFIRIN